MRSLGILLVGLALAVSACGHKSDPNAPQVEQGGTVQTAARAWAAEVPDLARDVLDALAETAAWSNDLVETWGTPQQVPPSRARFHQLLLRAQALPEGTPEIHLVNLALVRALTLMERAYDKYLAGLEQGRVRLLVEGDALLQQADAEFARVQPTMEKVVGAPSEGTVAAEVLKIRPVYRAANLEASEAFDLSVKMAVALKHGDLRQAAKLAGQAKRHVDRGLSGLEALSPPDYDELRAFLQNTVNGYRLLSDGFASYNEGIKNLDLKLLRQANQQTKLGFQDVNGAVEDLLRFLRSQ